MKPNPFSQCSVGSCLAGAVLALFAGCGGGGDSAPAPAADGALASPPTEQALRSTCSLTGFQAEALRLVNTHRAAGASCGSRGFFAATGPLLWHDALTAAALRHSDDMAAGNFFSHTGSDATDAGARAAAAGYVWSSWGENIAAGQASVASVVAGWMASEGHCANIMGAGFQDLGLACVSGGSGSRYGSYWTMVLGSRR